MNRRKDNRIQYLPNTHKSHSTTAKNTNLQKYTTLQTVWYLEASLKVNFEKFWGNCGNPWRQKVRHLSLLLRQMRKLLDDKKNKASVLAAPAVPKILCHLMTWIFNRKSIFHSCSIWLFFHQLTCKGITRYKVWPLPQKAKSCYRGAELLH